MRDAAFARPQEEPSTQRQYAATYSSRDAGDESSVTAAALVVGGRLHLAAVFGLAVKCADLQLRRVVRVGPHCFHALLRVELLEVELGGCALVEHDEHLDGGGGGAVAREQLAHVATRATLLVAAVDVQREHLDGVEGGGRVFEVPDEGGAERGLEL
eukprot:1972117-Rhodomonas_salina.1